MRPWIEAAAVWEERREEKKGEAGRQTDTHTHRQRWRNREILKYGDTSLCLNLSKTSGQKIDNHYILI